MTTQELKGKFYPTAVGSLPYRDSKIACEKILKNFKDIPFWPQLIRRSFFENMYVQFSEGLPGVVVEVDEKRIYVDTEKDISGEIEAVYEKFLSNDLDFFSISRDHAEGLYELVEAVKRLSAKPKFMKGQIIGPVSFGLTVTDEKKRSIFYNPELKEALLKILSMRARWQVRKLKETGLDCIIFIDEPYLASIGSSYISLKKEDALLGLNEIIQAVHKEGAVCGLHCCGNTDWTFLLSADIDILNFDAYNFSDTISLYPKELEAFLKKGGLLAWGIIPTTQEILKENDELLIEKLKKTIGLLVKKGIKKEALLDAMLITPSCGVGLVDEYLAQIIMDRTVGISERLKKVKWD